MDNRVLVSLAVTAAIALIAGGIYEQVQCSRELTQRRQFASGVGSVGRCNQLIPTE